MCVRLLRPPKQPGCFPHFAQLPSRIGFPITRHASFTSCSVALYKTSGDLMSVKETNGSAMEVALEHWGTPSNRAASPANC